MSGTSLYVLSSPCHFMLAWTSTTKSYTRLEHKVQIWWFVCRILTGVFLMEHRFTDLSKTHVLLDFIRSFISAKQIEKIKKNHEKFHVKRREDTTDCMQKFGHPRLCLIAQTWQKLNIFDLCTLLYHTDGKR